MQETQKPYLSIVIPAYNEEKYLAGCLESIQRFVNEVSVEVIVVDNGSTDNTARLAEEYSGVKVLRLPAPMGLPHARFPGFTAARGMLIASLDADTRVNNRWLPTLEREFAKDPSLVLLSGPYRYPEFPILLYWLHRVLNVLFTLFIKVIGSRRVTGGNFVMRREAFQTLQTSQDWTEFYGEDVHVGQLLAPMGKLKFMESFCVSSSTRRWKNEGLWKVAIRYIKIHLFSVFHIPYTQKHVDVR